MDKCMDRQRMFEIIDGLHEEYIRLLMNICTKESKTDDKAGVDGVADYLAGFAAEKGYDVKIKDFDKAGKCLVITYNVEGRLAPVSLSAHMDTVHEKGAFGCPPVKEDEKYVYGPGAVDCKGGIAVALLAMEALKKYGYDLRPIKLILQSDEEVSSKLSDLKTVEFMCSEAEGSVAFLNLEGFRKGMITLSRKGILRLVLDIKGKASHSSDYANGISAVKEAAYKIIDIEGKSDVSGTTYNCGVISGGTVPNTIPEKCVIKVDIRYKTLKDMEKAYEHVSAVASHSYLPGTATELKIMSKRPAMELKEANLRLFEIINRISQKHGLGTYEMCIGNGGSDAAYTTLAGIPTVDTLGIAGTGIHTLNERAEKESLRTSARLIASIIADFPDEPGRQS